MHPKAAGSIPGQGSYGRQPIDVSLTHLSPSSSLSFSLSLSLENNGKNVLR